MALASQSARSGSRRAYMTSRRRRRRGRWLVILLLIAAVVGSWWWFTDRTNESPASPDTTASVEDQIVARNAPPPRTSKPAPAAADRPRTLDPVTRDRGRRKPSNPPASTVDMAPKATVVASERPTPKTPTITSPADRIETPATPTTEPTTRSTVENTTREIDRQTIANRRLREAGELATTDPVNARQVLTEAWVAGLLDRDRERARALSTRLADATLLMNPGVPGSPWTRSYTIRPGDSMSRIMSREKVPTSQTFIARLNGLKNPNSIRAGRPLQLPTGRFHAVVDLSSKDLALFQEIEGSWDLLIALPIAVGPRLRNDADPMQGVYVVAPRGKRRNPGWTNPVTGDRWKANDPENPVGEHWVALEGLGDVSAIRGVAIHGTNDPGGIAGGRLPGSISLADDDIELLYQVLDTGDSTVEIRN